MNEYLENKWNIYDIAFCVNDVYVPFICVTIKSILENCDNRTVHFHILTDEISENNKSLLDEALEGHDNARYEIYTISDSRLNKLKVLSWSTFAWYRILLPTILSTDVKYILYLDADTLVLKDIGDIFLYDLDDVAVAGVLDPMSFDDKTYVRCAYDSQLQYLCSGVLLMNLNYWRNNHITDRIIDYATEEAERLEFPDQDAINVICKDCKRILPLRYGIQGSFFTKDFLYQKPYLRELIACLDNPVIIHYAGQAPWKIEWANHYYQKEWEQYNAMLKHPAERHFLTKGWPFVKMLLWNAMHPFTISGRRIKKREILKRIETAVRDDS